MTVGCRHCGAQVEDDDALGRHVVADHPDQPVLEPVAAAPDAAPGPEVAPGPQAASPESGAPGPEPAAAQREAAVPEPAPEPAAALPDAAVPEPAAQPGFLDRIRTELPFPLPPNPVLISIGVALVLLLGIIVASGRGSGSGPTAVSATLPPVSSTSTTAKPRGLDSAVVTAADLGGAWKALQPAKSLTADEYTSGVCGSQLWAHDTNGYQAAYEEGSGQYAHRIVVSSALEAPSSDAAGQQRQFVASSAFIPCLKQIVASSTLGAFDPTLHPQIGQLTVDPLNFDPDVPATGRVVTVGVDLLDGRIRVLFTEDVIFVFTGRYQGTLDIAWCSCTPGGQELVKPMTSQLVNRLEALPPDLASGTTA